MTDGRVRGDRRSVARPAASPATAEVVAVVRKIASQAAMFSAAAAIASESSYPAQMTDDRGVGQAVGGFGRDRPEGRQGESRDATV